MWIVERGGGGKSGKQRECFEGTGWKRDNDGDVENGWKRKHRKRRRKRMKKKRMKRWLWVREHVRGIRRK